MYKKEHEFNFKRKLTLKKNKYISSFCTLSRTLVSTEWLNDTHTVWWHFVQYRFFFALYFTSCSECICYVVRVFYVVTLNVGICSPIGSYMNENTSTKLQTYACYTYTDTICIKRDTVYLFIFLHFFVLRYVVFFNATVLARVSNIPWSSLIHKKKTHSLTI